MAAAGEHSSVIDALRRIDRLTIEAERLRDVAPSLLRLLTPTQRVQMKAAILTQMRALEAVQVLMSGSNAAE